MIFPFSCGTVCVALHITFKYISTVFSMPKAVCLVSAAEYKNVNGQEEVNFDYFSPSQCLVNVYLPCNKRVAQNTSIKAPSGIWNKAIA